MGVPQRFGGCEAAGVVLEDLLAQADEGVQTVLRFRRRLGTRCFRRHRWPGRTGGRLGVGLYVATVEKRCHQGATQAAKAHRRVEKVAELC
ncbi:hypothetical protein GCM10011572_31490 [Pseudoduganella buxea]|uniref:Uncharacterized protein n=1 Tax=Pseudoduganella buxea TaxID=1949069 RepID=A0ABQ1KVE0_9BURK|nr:hypothetical protein GCM10011572_31490 [Pseudoduganella buxea]